jgi:hypothetical protein
MLHFECFGSLHVGEYMEASNIFHFGGVSKQYMAISFITVYINTPHCPTDSVGHVFWMVLAEVR